MNEIYLCGNEPSWLQHMEHAIGCFQIKSDWEFTIACRAYSPRELLAVLENRGTKYGIYLLDVEYENEMNGLALGAAIRRLDPNAFLIYTAASGDMALETFRLRLRAVDFIVKASEDFQERLIQDLRFIEQKLACQDAVTETLVLRAGSSYGFFPKKEIFFIETIKNSRQIELHTVSGIHRYPGTLQECRMKLQRGFLLCRKGCLVNLRHIQSADRPTRTLLLVNGECCSCSVRQWNTLSRLYGMRE